MNALVFCLLLAGAAADDPDRELVACWACDEGSGTLLGDTSGQNNHGTIHGAKWVRCGSGFALEFNGVDAYVDCGAPKSLDIRGPMTLQAWAMPAGARRGEPLIAGKHFDSYAISNYGSAHWYISSGGNKCNGPLPPGRWTHIAGVFDGATLKMYINGVEAASQKSQFTEVHSGGKFTIGCNFPAKSFYRGLVDGVRVHARALGSREIVHYYNLEAAEKGVSPIDRRLIGRFTLETFLYPESEKAVAAVGFRWVDPLPASVQVTAALLRAGGNKPLQVRNITPDERYEAEAEFTLHGLTPGDYEMQVGCHRRPADQGAQTEKIAVRSEALPPVEKAVFHYPPAPSPSVPSPKDRVVGPLAARAEPPRYELHVAPGGGMIVSAGGKTWRIESTYSNPGGGQNRLLAGPMDTKAEPAGQAEPAWQVETGRLQVAAEGQFYAIRRKLVLEKSRIVVTDRITNKTGDVLGIILSNRINLEGRADVKVTTMANPTVFAYEGASGLGLIALDDLYQCQQQTASTDSYAEIRDEHFGLDARASYELQWAIYPTESADYYDFINQVRRDEGISARVEGAFGFVSRRKPPSPEEVARKSLRYASIGCLGHPLDRPEVSLEGFEFVKYPKEWAALTATMAATKARYPGMKVMFHVAHSLYACNNPEELFADSRALQENGRQVLYGPNDWSYYGRGYFSHECYDRGWRWWIFYPTLENSFGKAMIQAMEHMVDRMGATGMWADGYVTGYVPGSYSYDRWDGHSVSVDRKTGGVTRQKTCVPWVALPVLKHVVRLIAGKGGVVITNGQPGSRSLWREPMLTSCETGGGDATPISALHLGRSVTPLGNPNAIKNGRDVYRDTLAKLDYGALYFWFGDNDRLKHKTLVEHMYPITFETIHPGTVCGAERIITRRSGVYGWPGDRRLHQVHRYDARGALHASTALTSVDSSGVRTDLRLGREESAAIVKVPILAEPASPLNVQVRQHDGAGVRLALNGEGPLRLRIADGPFRIDAKTSYRVDAKGARPKVRPTASGLEVIMLLDGPAELTIER